MHIIIVIKILSLRSRAPNNNNYGRTAVRNAIVRLRINLGGTRIYI